MNTITLSVKDCCGDAHKLLIIFYEANLFRLRFDPFSASPYSDSQGSGDSYAVVDDSVAPSYAIVKQSPVPIPITVRPLCTKITQLWLDFSTAMPSAEGRQGSCADAWIGSWPCCLRCSGTYTIMHGWVCSWRTGPRLSQSACRAQRLSSWSSTSIAIACKWCAHPLGVVPSSGPEYALFS